MLRVNRPADLNVANLRAELATAGVSVGSEDLIIVGTELEFPRLNESRRAAVVAVVAAHTGGPSLTEANAASVRTALGQALANLQAIIDAPNPPAGDLTPTQLSNQMRSLTTAVKALARNQRRLVRFGLADFTGSD